MSIIYFFVRELKRLLDATYLYCTEESEVPDLLLLFYSILATFVDEAHVARPNYFSYVQIAETKAAYNDLVAKTGICNGR